MQKVIGVVLTASLMIAVEALDPVPEVLPPTLICDTTQECRDSVNFGPGSCCLYTYDVNNKKEHIKVCKNKKDLDFIFGQSKEYYDPRTREQHHPTLTYRYITYCIADQITAPGLMKEQGKTSNNSDKFVYPWFQPYADKSFVNVRDAANPRIEAQDFFVTRSVNSFEDQIEKWFDVWWFQFTEINQVILGWDIVMWTWDFLGNLFSGDQERWGHYPSMYNNTLSRFIMDQENVESVVGPFKWYDMFSFTGISQYFFEVFWLDEFWYIEIILAGIRWYLSDWTFATGITAPPDRNNIIPASLQPGRNDRTYWTTKEDGIDCNGNVGLGNFCFCPSQGYICSCIRDVIDPTRKKLECFDHYGYDCYGNVLDGEDMWCQETDNKYYLLNQKRPNPYL